MGKSYRKPYSAITGTKSAKQDKLVARRCWRRAQEQAIRDCRDWEDLVIPKRFEASFNDVWSWGRDGKQTYQGLEWAGLRNPFYMSHRSPYCTPEYLARHFEDRKRRFEEWQREVRRK